MRIEPVKLKELKMIILNSYKISLSDKDLTLLAEKLVRMAQLAKRHSEQRIESNTSE